MEAAPSRDTEVDVVHDPTSGLVTLYYLDGTTSRKLTLDYQHDPTCASHDALRRQIEHAIATSQESSPEVASPPWHFPRAAGCPLLRPNELPDGTDPGTGQREGTAGDHQWSWGSGQTRVTEGRGQEVLGWPISEENRDTFPGPGAVVQGSDGVDRVVVAVGDPPVGQIQYRFLFSDCPYILWTESGLTWAQALAYAGRLSTATQRSPASVAKQLVDAFVAFALDPGPHTLREVPLVDGDLALGLGPSILKGVSLNQAATPGAWTLTPLDGSFRGHDGRFSALDVIQRHVDGTPGDEGVRVSGDIQISTGAHPHCVGPPVAAPKGLQQLNRISVQPAVGAITSCLGWFTVDLFVNDDGDIVAVTMDLWEP